MAALLREVTGSWSSVIYIVAACDLLAAIFAFTELKRMASSYKETRYQSELDIQTSTQSA
jgi:hypothetical protein